MSMHVKSIVVGAAGAVTVGALALGGAALASAGPAGAAASYAAASATGSPTAPPGNPDGGPGKGRGHGRHGAPGQQQDRIIKHGLTGDTAVKVTQAAVAKEPTAYLLRVGKADDGTYRAHMMRPDGTHIVLTIDANFTVTSVADAPKPGPRGKPGPKPTTTASPSST